MYKNWIQGLLMAFWAVSSGQATHLLKDEVAEAKAHVRILWQLPSENTLNENIKYAIFKQETKIHQKLANEKLSEEDLDKRIEKYINSYIKILQETELKRNDFLNKQVALKRYKPELKSQILKDAVKIAEN